MNSFISWNDFRKFQSVVRYERRYVRTPQTEQFLEAVRRTAEGRLSVIQKGWNLIWRAQRGSCEQEMKQDDGTFYEDIAYPPERMKPRDRMGREGRINPKGISCFYGATTPETAMAEVRPWMGELVSVGRFEVLSEVKVVDCSKYHSKNSWHILLDKAPGSGLSTQEVEEAVWTHIDHAFSEPVTSSDEMADYVPTQILAEVFKADGYDGVAYKSMLTDDGYNIALFDPLKVGQVSGELYKTEKVLFKFGADPIDQYFLDAHGGIVRNVVVAIKPVPRGSAEPYA